MTRPNILWISFEDTSPRFGCYGDSHAHSPNVDRLAAQGVRFDTAFAVAGVCAPSRCAIITGMYPTFLGAHHMRVSHTHTLAPGLPTPYEAVPPPHVKLLPEILRAHGYYTCNNQKTDYQFNAPFTAWDECSAHAHWRRREPRKPFFAVFNNTQTHESAMWPEKGPEVEIDPSKLALPPYLADSPATRDALARHYQNIAANDTWAGKLLAELQEDGELDNTVVMLWSDHGEGLPRAKRWPYDTGIRVPLIVRLPKAQDAGRVENGLVSLIDLAPTVLSLAGIPAPAYLQGQPFLGPDRKSRDYVFATRDRHDESYDKVRAARDQRFKYLRHYYPYTPYLSWIPFRNRHPAMQDLWQMKETGAPTPHQQTFLESRPPEELYDTANDPWELRNLAESPDFQPELRRLRRALESWEQRYDRYGDTSESDMVAAWWPRGIQPTTAAPKLLPLDDATIGGTSEEPLASLASGALVQLYCSTQGASIGYRVNGGPWQLYTRPFPSPRCESVIEAKAIRIGYRESEIARFSLT